MALALPDLVDGLIRLDEPTPPAGPPEAAERWFRAFWAHAQGMQHLNPATLEAAKGAAQGVFLPALAPAFVVSPVPLPFLTALEGALRAAWAVLSTPAFLLPTYASGVPAPAPLAPLLLAVVPVGLPSPSKRPPRAMMAGIIHSWTLTHTVVPVAPPNTPIPFA